MECDKARVLIDEYADAFTDKRTAVELEAHFASCPGCASALGETRALIRAVGSARRFRAPEGFAERVMERLPKERRDLSGANAWDRFFDWLWDSIPVPLKVAEAAVMVVVAAAGIYSAGFIAGKLTASPVATASSAPAIINDAGANGVFATAALEYLDPVPPGSIGETYLALNESGNEG